MRSLISRTTAYFLFCLAIIGMLVGSVGFVHAASEAVTVSVPYAHTYDAEKDRTGDRFTYQIRPLEQAPVPNGSKDGVYYFTVKGTPEAVTENDQIDLKIVFPEAGVYQYEVSAYVPEKEDGFVYEDRVYKLNVIVNSDGQGGLKAPMVTIVGPDNRKYSRLQFSPGHAVKKQNVVANPITSPKGDGGESVPLDKESGQTPAQTDEQAVGQNPGQTGGQNGGGQNGGGQNGGGQAAGQNPVQTPSQTPTLGQKLRDYFNNEDTVTTKDLADGLLPKADYNRNYWALMNLIMLVITLGIAFVMIWRYLSRIDTDEDDYIIRREGKLRLLGLIPAIISAVTFIRTENLSLHVKMTDEWTVFMTVVLGIELLCAAIAYWKYDSDREDGNGSDNHRMERQAV